MKDYVCLMPFLDASESFVNGWECGTIWDAMTRGEAFKGKVVHTANKDQLTMMADHHGYECSFEAIDETWISFTAQPVDISSATK